MTWTLYDTDGNELYTTTGVYQPGASTASYSADHLPAVQGQQRHPERHHTSPARPRRPSPSLPCATIDADGVVTQLAYNTARRPDLQLHAGRQRRGELATTTYAYDGDGEQTSHRSPRTAT